MGALRNPVDADLSGYRALAAAVLEVGLADPRGGASYPQTAGFAFWCAVAGLDADALRAALAQRRRRAGRGTARSAIVAHSPHVREPGAV